MRSLYSETYTWTFRDLADEVETGSITIINMLIHYVFDMIILPWVSCVVQ